MELLTQMLLVSALITTPAGMADSVKAGDLEKLTTLEGTQFKTDKKKVLLYFWATWCPDCKEKLAHEFPKLQLPPNLELVTVNTDKDVERTKHLLSKEKYNLTVVRDPDKSVATALKVFSVPYWAVLTREADGWRVVAAEAGGDLEKARAAWSKE